MACRRYNLQIKTKIKLRLQNGIRGGDIAALNIVHLDLGFGMLHVGPGQGSATKPTAIWASRSSTTGPTQTRGLEMLPFCHYCCYSGVCVCSSSILNMQPLWIGV